MLVRGVNSGIKYLALRQSESLRQGMALETSFTQYPLRWPMLLQSTVKWAAKNVHFVLQQWCKTGWIAMLHVLPPTNQTCLAKNQARRYAGSLCRDPPPPPSPQKKNRKEWRPWIAVVNRVPVYICIIIIFCFASDNWKGVVWGKGASVN